MTLDTGYVVPNTQAVIEVITEEIEMTTATILQPPALDHDAMMLKRFDSKVSPDGRLERRIVWNLIAHLEREGFQIHSVYDGGETTRVYTGKDAMELIFNLDVASLRFFKGGHREHGVLLVLGNGIDIVSDWNYFHDDRDGFNAAMDAFDSELYA